MLSKLFVAMVGLALLGGFADANAGGPLTLRVNTDGFIDFDSTIAGTTALGVAAFYVGGDICKELDLGDDCTPIGKFHCWGWLIGPDQAVGPVSQEYNLFERGKILVQGIEAEGPRAVVGGLVISETFAVRRQDSIFPSLVPPVSSLPRSSSWVRTSKKTGVPMASVRKSAQDIGLVVARRKCVA